MRTTKEIQEEINLILAKIPLSPKPKELTVTEITILVLQEQTKSIAHAMQKLQ